MVVFIYKIVFTSIYKFNLKMPNKLIKNMDNEIWRKFTGYCKIKNIRVGILLNQILKNYLKNKIK